MRKVNKLWILASLLFISFSRHDHRDTTAPEPHDVHILPALPELPQDGKQQCCMAPEEFPAGENNRLLQNPGSGISTSIL